MTSSTPNLSQIAELFIRRYEMWRGAPKFNAELELTTLLRQTREEAEAEFKEQPYLTKWAENIRKEAYEEAAKLVEFEHKHCEPPMCEIANKVRALASGLEEGK